MKLKRKLVFIILAGLLTCTACSKKTETEKNKMESQPTEIMDDNTGEGEQEQNPGTTNGEGSSSEGKDTTSNDSASGETESENQESMEAYAGFLNNETKVHFDQYMYCLYYKDTGFFFENETGYTLSEVLDIIATCYYQDSTNTKINYIDYSYIDCGKDGVNELALRFNGMDISSPDDDSTLVYIIKNIDGKLNLCYDYQTQDRDESAMNESAMNEYGYYKSAGSNSAIGHYDEYGAIDKNGKWQLIVYSESELDINQISWCKIATIAETKGIKDAIELDAVWFKDNSTIENSEEVDKIGHYYTFYIYDEQYELIKDADLYTNSVYKDIFDEAGVPFITPDEVDEMIAEKEEKVGVTEEIKAGNEIVWKALDGNLFVDYVGR